MKTKNLTMLEFEGEDMKKAEKIAKSLGFGTNTAYTSTSALIGLFCINSRPTQTTGCIIKTEELGFLFVGDGEDYHKGYGWGDLF